MASIPTEPLVNHIVPQLAWSASHVSAQLVCREWLAASHCLREPPTGPWVRTVGDRLEWRPGIVRTLPVVKGWCGIDIGSSGLVKTEQALKSVASLYRTGRGCSRGAQLNIGDTDPARVRQVLRIVGGCLDYPLRMVLVHPLPVVESVAALDRLTWLEINVQPGTDLAPVCSIPTLRKLKVVCHDGDDGAHPRLVLVPGTLTDLSVNWPINRALWDQVAEVRLECLAATGGWRSMPGLPGLRRIHAGNVAKVDALVRRLPDLDDLTLESGRWDQQDLEAVPPLARLTLSRSDNALNADDPRAPLAGVVEWLGRAGAGLCALHLHSVRLGCEVGEVPHLARALRGLPVTTLGLRDNFIGRHSGDVDALLDALSSMPRLDCLVLTDNALGAQVTVVDAIDRCCRAQALTSLDLSKNHFGGMPLLWLDGEARVDVLARADGETRVDGLTSLNLSRNKLGQAVDDAVHLSAMLAPMTGLGLLDLEDNHLGRHGIDSLLHTLATMPVLDKLDLSNNPCFRYNELDLVADRLVGQPAEPSAGQLVDADGVQLGQLGQLLAHLGME